MAFVNGAGAIGRDIGRDQAVCARRERTVVAVARRVRPRPKSEDELIGATETRTHFEKSSRFPADWSNALIQAGDATAKALSKRETRLLVELWPPTRPVELLEAIAAPLCEEGKKVKVFFDSMAEAAEMAASLSPALADMVSMSFLGDREDMGDSDIALVFQPNNISGHPRNIEDVEWLHYRLEWKDPKPIVLINPKLMSLGSGLDAVGNVRRPMFLEDYAYAYFLDPNIFRDENIHGGLLCEYPRKWEMYTFRANGGYRLIAQHRAKPNAEKVLVQFLWRSDMTASKKQLDRAVDRGRVSNGRRSTARLRKEATENL